jgi:hypothetical protein
MAWQYFYAKYNRDCDFVYCKTLSKKMRRGCYAKYNMDCGLVYSTLLKSLSVIIFGSPVPQGADPSPVPIHVATAGKNHLYEETTPPPPSTLG